MPSAVFNACPVLGLTGPVPADFLPAAISLNLTGGGMVYKYPPPATNFLRDEFTRHCL